MANSGTRIYMANVLGAGMHNHRELTRPLDAVLPSGYWETIPAGFVWDGSSVPWVFQGLFPRHRHPIASCRHDWRCGRAKNAAERLFADQQFREDVGRTSWAVTKHTMYLGVRIGALLGIGSKY